MSRLTEKEIHQMDLFEWADQNEEEEKARQAEIEKLRAQKEQEAREQVRKEQARKEKQAKLDAMMSKVNTKFGNGTLKKGNQ